MLIPFYTRHFIEKGEIPDELQKILMPQKSFHVIENRIVSVDPITNEVNVEKEFPKDVRISHYDEKTGQVIYTDKNGNVRVEKLGIPAPNEAMIYKQQAEADRVLSYYTTQRDNINKRYENLLSNPKTQMNEQELRRLWEKELQALDDVFIPRLAKSGIPIPKKVEMEDPLRYVSPEKRGKIVK